MYISSETQVGSDYKHTIEHSIADPHGQAMEHILIILNKMIMQGML